MTTRDQLSIRCCFLHSVKNSKRAQQDGTAHAAASHRGCVSLAQEAALPRHLQSPPAPGRPPPARPGLPRRAPSWPQSLAPWQPPPRCVPPDPTLPLGTAPQRPSRRAQVLPGGSGIAGEASEGLVSLGGMLLFSSPTVSQVRLLVGRVREHGRAVVAVRYDCKVLLQIHHFTGT